MQDSEVACVQSAKHTLAQMVAEYDGGPTDALVGVVTGNFVELLQDDEGANLVKSLPSVLGNIAQKGVVKADDYYEMVLRQAFHSQAVGFIDKLCVLGHANLIVKVALESLDTAAILAQIKPRNPVILQLFLQAQPDTSISHYLPAPELAAALPYLVFKLRSPPLAALLLETCRNAGFLHDLVSCVLQEWHTARWIERADDAAEKCNDQAVLTLLVYETLATDLAQDNLKLLMQGVSARLNSPRAAAHASGEVRLSQLIASRLAEIQGKPDLSIGMTLADYLSPPSKKPVEERVEVDSDDDSDDDPCHYEDLLMSLSSEHKGRFESALRCAGSLIRKDLAELDLLFSRLSTMLLRMLDKFGTQSFQTYKVEGLAALAVMRPLEAVSLWRPRLLSQETSLAEKECILSALLEGSYSLSQPQPAIVEPFQPLKIPSRGKTKLKHSHMSKKPRAEANRFLPVAVPFIRCLTDLDPSTLEPFLLVQALRTLARFFEQLGEH